MIALPSLPQHVFDVPVIYAFLPASIVGYGHIMPAFDLLKDALDKGYKGRFSLLADNLIYCGDKSGEKTGSPCEATHGELLSRLKSPIMNSRFKAVFDRMNGGKEFLSKLDEATEQDMAQFVNHEFQNGDDLDAKFFPEEANTLCVVSGFTRYYVDEAMRSFEIKNWFRRKSGHHPNVIFWASSGLYGVEPSVYLRWRHGISESMCVVNAKRYLLCAQPSTIAYLEPRKAVYLVNPNNWNNAFLGVAVVSTLFDAPEVWVIDAQDKQKEQFAKLQEKVLSPKLKEAIKKVKFSEKGFSLKQHIQPETLVVAEGVGAIQDACFNGACSLRMFYDSGQAVKDSRKEVFPSIKAKEKILKIRKDCISITGLLDDAGVVTDDMMPKLEELFAYIRAALPVIANAEKNMLMDKSSVVFVDNEPALGLALKEVKDKLQRLRW